MVLNLFNSSRVANAAMVLMLVANKMNAAMAIQSIETNPLPIEEAGKAHRTWFIAFLIWTLFSALATALLTYFLWRAGNKQQDAIQSYANVRIAEAGDSAAKA